ITPDKNNNWINLSENDWDDLIAVCDKNVKAGKSEEALFELFSTGIVTARDEWVYDLNRENLKSKISFFINEYTQVLSKSKDEPELLNIGTTIKWSRNLKNYLKRGINLEITEKNILRSLKRPFYKPYFYFEKGMNDEIGYFKSIIEGENKIIGINNNSPLFNTLCNNTVFDFASLIVSSGQTQCLPLYRYQNGERMDNITDWGLQLFTDHYLGTEEKREIFQKQWRILHPPAWTERIGFPKEEVGDDPYQLYKIDLFYYVYAVLHHPSYRKKYELNLKREFPRIPLYDNFPQWRAWGEQLMNLHINYEEVNPYPLDVLETVMEAVSIEALEKFKKAKLKANKAAGTIELDGLTVINGIPAIAWDYKLGNRSALEWILDQYKEKKPSDPTIAEKFNTYKFADYKEQVIDLLKRVCTVSVETMKILNEMPD
ncbi:MAG TPA: type ISP restriction/modification enzyme, partial [Allocoleopsis sp.]